MNNDARSISNLILDTAENRGIQLSNAAIQKILYFSFGHYAAEYQDSLFQDRIEAWEYGPVVRDIYNQFKIFGSGAVRNRATVMDFRSGKTRVAEYALESNRLLFVSKIIEFYSAIPVGKLIELSHLRGSPWDRAWNHASVTNPGMEISKSEIRRYFQTAWSVPGAQLGRA